MFSTSIASSDGGPEQSVNADRCCMSDFCRDRRTDENVIRVGEVEDLLERVSFSRQVDT